MNPSLNAFARVALSVAAALLSLQALGTLQAQNVPAERSFPQSKGTIEKALKAMQTPLAGHLPVLDGFTKPGQFPLDRYQRGYYQAAVTVSSTASGGSLVRVTAKVTAWYNDPVASRSGYQMLPSNGRLETDLLDQLQEQLGGQAVAAATQVAPTSTSPPESTKAEPAVSAPDTTVNRDFGSAMNHSLSATARSTMPHTTASDAAPSAGPVAPPKPVNALQTEAESLEEILKNTGHPNNLVAVKKSGTPVVPNPSLTAKPQFLASLHDEFELLDFNTDWVHVRISGLSRGWIWRNSVEMPEGIADTEAHPAAALTSAGDLFHVVREEAAPFPGDWEPLRSRKVKIISVQKTDEAKKEAGSRDRLEYAKFLFEKSYKDMQKTSPDLQGVVVIFDSADGGMIAATTAVLQQWIAGNLSDSALWHKCFFDPPETLDSATAAASK